MEEDPELAHSSRRGQRQTLVFGQFSVIAPRTRVPRAGR